MSEFKSLGGDYFNGKDSATSYAGAAARVDMLFVGDIPSASKMSCGGPVELDDHLRGINKIELGCGSCAVSSQCTIGLSRSYN